VEVRAITKGLRGSSQKVRRVIDTVRGKKVAEALSILRFLPTPMARQVAKVVKSAAANAENNFQMSPTNLKITKIYANVGTTMKRFRPRSRGRVSPILKRSTHVTVIVEEV
jgi:large subunit ribosomal protein L22